MKVCYSFSRRKTHSDSGFTLLEILIATAIFAVIATIVYSALNASISRVGAIKDNDSVFDMAAACMHRMTLDLQAAYVEQYPLFKPPDYDDPADPYAFMGDIEYVGAESFSRLRFASLQHLPVSTGDPEKPAPEGGIAQISYYVQEAGEDSRGYVLKRGDYPFPYDDDEYRQQDADDPVLCTNIVELKFSFHDNEGTISESWDSSEEDVKFATPKAVEIFFKIKTNQGEYPFFTRVFMPVFRKPLERVEK